MKINFLGDSITEGACATAGNRYTTLVCKHFGAVENNYGIGGTRIAKQKKIVRDWDDKDFVLRAPTMDKDADLVFVFGGTNDYGHGDAPIGTAEDKTPYTFYGALIELVEYLISTYGKEKLCFILPIHRFNEDNPLGEGGRKETGEPLSTYVRIEREIFEKYGVEYLDLSHVFPIPLVETGDELTTDGLHPNDVGHKLLADQLIEYIEKKKL